MVYYTKHSFPTDSEVIQKFCNTSYGVEIKATAHNPENKQKEGYHPGRQFLSSHCGLLGSHVQCN